MFSIDEYYGRLNLRSIMNVKYLLNYGILPFWMDILVKGMEIHLILPLNCNGNAAEGLIRITSNFQVSIF